MANPNYSGMAKPEFGLSKNKQWPIFYKVSLANSPLGNTVPVLYRVSRDITSTFPDVLTTEQYIKTNEKLGIDTYTNGTWYVNLFEDDDPERTQYNTLIGLKSSANLAWIFLAKMTSTTAQSLTKVKIICVDQLKKKIVAQKSIVDIKQMTLMYLQQGGVTDEKALFRGNDIEVNEQFINASDVLKLIIVNGQIQVSYHPEVLVTPPSVFPGQNGQSWSITYCEQYLNPSFASYPNRPFQYYRNKQRADKVGEDHVTLYVYKNLWIDVMAPPIPTGVSLAEIHTLSQMTSAFSYTWNTPVTVIGGIGEPSEKPLVVRADIALEEIYRLRWNYYHLKYSIIVEHGDWDETGFHFKEEVVSYEFSPVKGFNGLFNLFNTIMRYTVSPQPATKDKLTFTTIDNPNLSVTYASNIVYQNIVIVNDTRSGTPYQRLTGITEVGTRTNNHPGNRLYIYHMPDSSAPQADADLQVCVKTSSVQISSSPPLQSVVHAGDFDYTYRGNPTDPGFYSIWTTVNALGDFAGVLGKFNRDPLSIPPEEGLLRAKVISPRRNKEVEFYVPNPFTVGFNSYGIGEEIVEMPGTGKQGLEKLHEFDLLVNPFNPNPNIFAHFPSEYDDPNNNDGIRKYPTSCAVVGTPFIPGQEGGPTAWRYDEFWPGVPGLDQHHLD